MLPFQPRRPLYIVALTVFFTTAFLVTNGEHYGWQTALVAAVGLAIVLCIPLLRRVGALYLIFLGVVFASLGTCLYYAFAVQPLQGLDGTTAQITARVTAVPQGGEGQYLLIVTDSDRVPIGTRVSVAVENAQIQPEQYGSVNGNVSLYMPQSTRLRGDGVFLAGELQVITKTSSAPRWHERLSDTLRAGLLEGIYAVLPSDVATFSAGVCVGDMSALSADVTDDFRKSGLAHLTVVSGLHMTILTGAVMGALKLLRVRRSTSVAVALTVLWAFMLMVGFSFSVIRAAVMLHCVMLGGAFRRRADSRTSLAVALLLIVSANPYAVCDVGFLLSFAATWGMVVLLPMWNALLQASPAIQKHTLLRQLCAPVGASLAAMLFTAPILANAFGTVAVLSPLANVLTGYPVSVMLPLTLAGGVLYQIPFLQIPAKLCLWIAGWLARWILAVARWIADISVTALQIRHPVWLFLLLLLPFTVYGAAKLLGKRGVVRVLVANVVTVACLIGAFRVLFSNTVWLRVADAGYSTVTVVEAKAYTAAVISGEDAYACERARQYIVSCGMDTLDALIVTDSRASSYAALNTLLEAIPAKTVICPDGDTFDGATAHIEEGTPLTLSDNLTLATIDGWWRLDIGGTRVLLCAPDGEFADIPADWHQTHLAVLRQSVPDDMYLLTARQVVAVCTDEHLAAVTKQLPHSTYPVTMTATHGDAAFGTAGEGDLVVADRFWL